MIQKLRYTGTSQSCSNSNKLNNQLVNMLKKVMHMRKINFKLSKLKRSVFVGWQQQVAEWKITCRDEDAVEHYIFFSFSQNLLTKNTPQKANTEGSLCYAFTCVQCFLDVSALKLLRFINLTLSMSPCVAWASSANLQIMHLACGVVGGRSDFSQRGLHADNKSPLLFISCLSCVLFEL